MVLMASQRAKQNTSSKRALKTGVKIVHGILFDLVYSLSSSGKGLQYSSTFFGRKINVNSFLVRINVRNLDTLAH